MDFYTGDKVRVIGNEEMTGTLQVCEIDTSEDSLLVIRCLVRFDDTELDEWIDGNDIERVVQR
jgi:hypothetical protein